MRRFFQASSALALLLLAPPAFGFELDTLLPEAVPGYGTMFMVGGLPMPRDNGNGFDLGDVRVNPELDVGAGYDSAPNGARPGSSIFTETPMLTASDATIGLGGFAAGSFSQAPQNSAQSTEGGTIAVGEKAALTTQTITAGAAYVAAEATGFALTTLAIRRPIAFTVADARVGDAVQLGLFTVTPRFEVSRYGFDQFAGLDRRDTREELETAYDDGGPWNEVLLLHATQSAYRTSALNSDSEAALAGLEDDATDIITVRLLAGAARRHTGYSGSMISPVAEAAADWVPDRLDKVSLRLAREVDDPGDISATPYTLDEAKLSLMHEYLRDVTLGFSSDIQSADYIGSPLKETVVSSGAVVNWQLNRSWTLTAQYMFNDRQANYLRAANEHVATLGLRWTP